jgi:Flp pilus assembly pilin Flp
MLSKFWLHLRDERGAEIVEWIVVVIILAITAGFVFGPGGALQNALVNGIDRIADLLNSAGTTP